MTSSSWPAALTCVLRSEGGWSDHPADPGGATMRGITLAVFRAARGEHLTKDDLRRISDADVEDIYRRRYWLAVRADDLPAGIDLAVFDAAVNSGPGRAARWLQDAIGVLPDGAVGPITLSVARTTPAMQTIDAISDAREAWLRSLPTWRAFGAGWLARVQRVRQEARRLANEAEGQRAA